MTNNGAQLSEHLHSKLIAGADELALVRSGLDDTMREAFQSLKAVYDSSDQVQDYRMAAYIVAVEKIARTYLDIGVY
jgi:glutamate dehydrogenase (NAD(P)+)